MNYTKMKPITNIDYLKHFMGRAEVTPKGNLVLIYPFVETANDVLKKITK